jgi:hypothetical protein
MANRGYFAARRCRQAVEELHEFEDDLDDEFLGSFDDYDPDRFDRR